MIEPSGDHRAAAAPPIGDAAAASSRDARRLLDAAVAHTIATLAHDLRNSLGVVSMQVEAIAVRALAEKPDMDAIKGHADTASEHIERLADMTNALIAFARGRTSSDLAVIVAEAAALVPLRRITLSMPSLAAVGLDPMLTRAIALEVLVMALAAPSIPTLVVSSTAAGSTLSVNSDRPLVPDDALEWVVQFRSVGGQINATDDGLRLQFPPIS
jgi:signal transduction histidine kinase